MFVVADDVIEILDLYQSVVTEYALGCWETAKAVGIIEAEILLEVPTSRFGRAGMGV